MKILIIIDSLGSGGAERSTAVLADYLFKMNIPFDIVCLEKKKVGVQQQLIEKNYSITFLEKSNFYNQTKKLVSIIKRGKYSIVHSILFRANLRTRFAKLWVDFCHLESLVNTTYSEERFNDKRVNHAALWFYKKLDEFSASRCVDHFHSITEAVKQHYVEAIKLNSNEITVIPRGRSPIINSYCEKPSRNMEGFSIINVGRHEFQKGQIYLLKAVKILIDKGYPVCLTILGRDGSTTCELQRFIARNSLEDVVSLEGFKENVSEYLLHADLFVFPSLFEGLGGALIEAQAAGLPIACNDIPVLHEVVQKNINAKFFNVHDTASIVDSLRFFIENPEECNNFGKESFENFNLKFQEKGINEKMIELYKSLCLDSEN